MFDRMVKIDKKENGYIIQVKYPATYCEYICRDEDLEDMLVKIRKYLEYGETIK